MFDGSVTSWPWPTDSSTSLVGVWVPAGSEATRLRFVRFRPPVASRGSDGTPGVLPHIRLDRALEFLLGDRLA